MNEITRLRLAYLLILIFSSCTTGQTYQPTYQPTVKINNPTIAGMIEKMDEANIYSTTEALQSIPTRVYGTAGNLEAAGLLYSKMSGIPGLNVEYQDESFKNIIGILPGIDKSSDEIVMVGAHYDSISSDPAKAPGATDNACGVAIVLELARIMSQYQFNHTIAFALWNDEENSQLGSKAYVEYAAGNSLDIPLYFNFDSTCYDPDDNFILDIMYNTQSSWVKDMITQYNTLYGINFALTDNVHTCTSDHKSFWSRGYTAVMTHEETHGPSHTPSDTIDKVSTKYALKNGQLGMAVLAQIAEVAAVTPVPPNTPSIPSGPASGVSGTSYSYSTSATDPDGDQVRYTLDWGDGTNSTTDLVNSGTNANESHSWNTAGTYQVKAMATDSKGVSSGWSGILTVSISPTAPSLTAFVRGYGSLWYKKFDGTSWGSWQSLGGDITDLDAVSSGNNIYAFVQGYGSLWYKKFDGTSWGSWQSLGGDITALDTVSSGNNIYVFVRGYGSLWYKKFDGTSWGSWQSLGGGDITALDTVSSGNDIYAFVRAYGSLWYRKFDGASWGSWQSLGGDITALDTVSSGNNIYVFVRGYGSLWYKKFDGTSWGSWQSLGGDITALDVISA